MRRTCAPACLAILIGLWWLPFEAAAHHSVAGFFDPEGSVEIRGVIRAVRWRNPHTIFEVDVADASGTVATWRIESGALGVLRTRGLAREFVKPGDEVRVVGDPSLRSEHEMFARNMLLANGKEVMLTARSKPYFSVDRDSGVLEAVFDAEVIAAARRNADGIFRVWSTDVDDTSSARIRMLDGDYPLLDSARAVRDRYDPGDTALLGCTKWTMPRIMANPLPMEFVRDGDNIHQRFEEDDNVRIIYMKEAPAPDSIAPSTLGFSTGRWDGETLVVETTRLAPERLDDLGTPFSAALRLLERFTLSEDGGRLDYVLTISDPNTFSEPFETRRHWYWRPEIVVGEYRCEEDQRLP